MANNDSLKKDEQWLIDRAYNMSIDNEERTYFLLECIKGIKDLVFTKEEGLIKATELKAIPNSERYLRSTSTGIRCYGLISDTYSTTEVSESFLNKLISFQDMIFLQLIKKEHKFSDSSIVLRPLFILLKALLELKKIDEKECWIDAYDYLYYLTEIRSKDQILDVANNIIRSRREARIIKYKKIDDYDIWVSALLSTGLLKQLNDVTSNSQKKLTLNFDEIGLIEFLVDNEEKLPFINEYCKNSGSRKEKKVKQELYGCLTNGFYMMLPEIILSNEKFNTDNLPSNIKKEILLKYLVDGKSFRDIGHEVFGEELDKQGLFSNNIVKSYGLTTEHKGIWKPFKNKLHLLKLHDKYKALGELYTCIFGKDENDYWILPANHAIYDHFGSFERNGFIDWKKTNKFKKGDYVYIYSTAPMKKITALTKVVEENIDINSKQNDDEFWKIEPEYQEDQQFVRLKLIEKFNTDKLLLNVLCENGLASAPQMGIHLSGLLLDYILKVTKKVGINKIYYGIPGCGKSYHVEHTVLRDVLEENIIRTTFYLDYTNADFVGQILPKVEKDVVSYTPVPGPFTKALARAYDNPNEMVYLVIEEINRGNAAAIFGDIFQLLDRKKDGEHKGESEYPIFNQFIESYLKHEGIESPCDNGNIIIPSNLTILATMNTSDQNVFPLDTAFTRRWKKKRIVTKVEEKSIGKKYLPNSKMKWEDFVNGVNKHIANSSQSLNAEDKQIGAYFIDEELLSDVEVGKTENVEEFCDKVIHYIWEDISKFEREEWFTSFTEGMPKTYEEVLNKVLENNDLLSVFNKDKVFPELKKKEEVK